MRQLYALGNLWVLDPQGMVNGAATPALFEFSAAQLAALATDNAPDPIATITSASLKTPQQAVIDSVGNAWITDHDSNTVLAFTALQLTAINAAGAFGVAAFATNQLATGTPTPATFIVGTATTLNAPEGCMFGPLVK
jgi:hypothetical protein